MNKSQNHYNALLDSALTDNTPPDNAMSEIALALAMGFFSIMILAIVSMGSHENNASQPVKKQTQNIAALALQQNDTKNKTKQNKATAQKVTHKDKFIIFYKNQFFDQDLKQISDISISSLNVAGDGKIILAVTPNLSITDSMKALGRINKPNVIITELNQQWLNRLDHQ